MCFQDFAHTRCGHIVVTESKCELALDIAFYMKAACPRYRIQSVQVQDACGSGKFYCQETREGRFLEQIHRMRTQAEAELSEIETRSAYLNATVANFTKAADQANISQEVRKKHPGYTKIFVAHQGLKNQRQKVGDKLMSTSIILSEGFQYCGRQREHSLTGGANAIRPFTLPAHLTSKLPTELQAQLAALTDQKYPSNAIVTSVVTTEVLDDSADVGEYEEYKRSSLQGDSLPSKPRNSMLPEQRLQTGSVFSPSGYLTPRLESSSIPKKRGRSKRTMNPDGIIQDTSPDRQQPTLTENTSMVSEESRVRRSARVGNKKVSYAESVGSSGQSREPSPEKSDADSFSPSKSDANASPPKNDTPHPRRGRMERRPIGLNNNASSSGSSLNTLIEEWKRRNVSTSLGPPSFQPHPLAGAGEQLAGQSHLGSEFTHRSVPNDVRLSAVVVPNEAPYTTALSENSVREGYAWRPQVMYGPPQRYAISPGDNSHSESPLLRQRTDFRPNPAMLAASAGMFDMNTRARAPSAVLQQTQSNGPPVPVFLGQHSMNQSWLMNTPAFNGRPGLVPAQQQAEAHYEMTTPREHRDSAVHFSPTPSVASATPAFFIDRNYERIRRSFSATTDLTPTTAVDPSKADTDPKKRKLPASSPLQVSNKRMRLSFPGEDVAESVYDPKLPYEGSGTMSSPSNMQSQEQSGGKSIGQTPPSTQPDVVATPALILAPTAVMYAPRQAQQSENANDGALAADLLPSDARAGVVNETEVLFSDIDWSMISDDVV